MIKELESQVEVLVGALKEITGLTQNVVPHASFNIARAALEKVGK